MKRERGKSCFWISVLIVGILLCFATTSFAETDVTDKVDLVKSRLRYDRGAGTSYLDVSLQNISQDVLLAPIKVVIDSISSPDITVANPDGTTSDGKPYFEYQFSSEFAKGTFHPNDTSNAKTWRIDNPYAKRFRYETKIIGYIPSPTITSLSPQFGEIGTELVITGYNFQSSQENNKVLFDDIQAQASNWTNDSITTTVPSGVSNCTVKLVVDNQESNSFVFFTAAENELIKDVTPEVDCLLDRAENFIEDPITGLEESIARLLVVFKEDATIGQLRTLLGSINAQVVGTFVEINLIAVDIKSPNTLDSMKQQLSELKNNPVVKLASVNKLIGTNFYPQVDSPFAEWGWNDNNSSQSHGLYTYLGGNWGHKFARFPGAWNAIPYISPDTKVRIGIIDRGFDTDHPDLENVLSKQFVGSLRKDDHGNHVAGIIGAEFNNNLGINGVNPFSEMYGSAPSGLSLGDNLDWSGVIFQVRDLVNHRKVKVINMSLGWDWGEKGGNSPNTDPSRQDEVRKDGEIAQELAENFLNKKNVLVVVSAGNDGDSFDENNDNVPEVVNAKWNSPFCWAKSEGAPNIVVVGAAESGEGGVHSFRVSEDEDRNVVWHDTQTLFDGSVTRSDYSNGGSVVTISAPGSCILSTFKNSKQKLYNNKDKDPEGGFRVEESKKYGFLDGTSMSTPMVTGLIGFMYAFAPEIEPDTVIDYLTNNNEGQNRPTRSYEDPVEGGQTPVIDAFATMMRIPNFKKAVLDVNNDKQIDGDDLNIVKRGMEGEGDLEQPFGRADLNGDGKVDQDDYRLFPFTFSMSNNQFHLGDEPYEVDYAYYPDGVMAYARAWDYGNATQYTQSRSFYIRPNNDDYSTIETIDVEVEIIHSGDGAGCSQLSDYSLYPDPDYQIFEVCCRSDTFTVQVKTNYRYWFETNAQAYSRDGETVEYRSEIRLKLPQ
ncbi:MAG: S8 family serine peptidase [Desulfobulbaceae bacterium]|nr:S8 family serine peptidase [Desulfobulbaceae bacterium]